MTSNLFNNPGNVGSLTFYQLNNKKPMNRGEFQNIGPYMAPSYSWLTFFYDYNQKHHLASYLGKSLLHSHAP